MTADGTLTPWVQDFGGVWHQRPGDDEWLSGPVQARTVCGLAIPSISASAVHPLSLPQPADDPEELCGACPGVEA